MTLPQRIIGVGFAGIVAIVIAFIIPIPPYLAPALATVFFVLLLHLLRTRSLIVALAFSLTVAALPILFFSFAVSAHIPLLEAVGYSVEYWGKSLFLPSVFLFLPVAVAIGLHFGLRWVFFR